MDVITDPQGDAAGRDRERLRQAHAAQRAEYRYGLGVRTLANNEKTGPIIAARTIQPGDHVTFITSGGMALRTPVETISIIGRTTQGVQLMNLAPGDRLASAALLEEGRRAQRAEALKAESDALATIMLEGQEDEEPGDEEWEDELDGDEWARDEGDESA
jgi:DNA gyrase subunit A